MGKCCEGNCSLDTTKANQRISLRWVLAINVVMFFVIGSAAIYANTSALLADSLDNFGDAVTYALSLYALTQGMIFKAKVAYLKGVLIFASAVFIIGQVVYKLFVPSVPIFEVMGAFSLLSMVANSICFLILWRHRHEDINMTSVWECSKNDIMVNFSVLITSIAVWLTHSFWPDIFVAIILSGLLLRSAWRIIASSKAELHNAFSSK
ncbi:Cobalt/zinc/cadmium resistance protein CzcD [Bathymodiolus thermophilus thioautotrophic gill symbiont]|uniref:cation transporter n=1 Tax=Bathymodiolus thermophilus thioautotrophic gill symbiont TaxID=2360 RepID=UPI00192BF5D8|nr:cation transporter [Bathymodiolus thermophilus thioautotrophic gill symbiont]CAB5496524.1 Cobalt/zinc/cadmium resistance protein CzcD [Bathymodiolus thermophilus thioautotrophic gill symbiont]